MRRAFLRAVWGSAGPQGGGWRTGHGRSAVQWYASRGVPSRTWIVPQGRKPFFQQMLHGAVVGVGIRSDIPGNGLAVVRSTAEETVCPAVPGQTVDGEIGGVVPPGALYPGIGGLGGIQQRKHPMYPGFIAKDPADALSDIGADQLRRRIGAAPLSGISGLQHIFLRRAIDGHKLRLIGGSGSADGQHGGLLSWWRCISVIRRV